MSKRPLNERLDELYEVLLSGTNSVSGYDRLVSASAVEEVRAINAELLAALTGIMPWTTNNGPDWATPEAMNRNRRMYENAFTAAEIAIEKAKGD